MKFEETVLVNNTQWEADRLAALVKKELDKHKGAVITIKITLDIEDIAKPNIEAEYVLVGYYLRGDSKNRIEFGKFNSTDEALIYYEHQQKLDSFLQICEICDKKGNVIVKV